MKSNQLDQNMSGPLYDYQSGVFIPRANPLKPDNPEDLKGI